MDSLNLSTAPPRAARAEAGGIIFLPRTIDKARAMLPGGDIGEYTIPGLSEMMLERFGIALDDFVAAVAKASSDEEVGTFVRAASSDEKIAEWNGWIRQRQPRGGDREAAYELYPWLRERPDLIIALDVLAEDDRRLFA
jgi:predicted mannosyl-3-phosphoglycerate phosphatase (HAD superfamily)